LGPSTYVSLQCVFFKAILQCPCGQTDGQTRYKCINAKCKCISWNSRQCRGSPVQTESRQCQLTSKDNRDRNSLSFCAALTDTASVTVTLWSAPLQILRVLSDDVQVWPKHVAETVNWLNIRTVLYSYGFYWRSVCSTHLPTCSAYYNCACWSFFI